MRLESRLIEESEVQTAARNERTRVTLRDKFQPHGLSKETLADLVAQLRGVSGLRNAYFIKKRVKHFQDHPLYVLGYSVAGLFPSRRNKRAAEVLERIQRTVRFPGETLFVNLDRENHRFRRKFRQMRWAEILNRDSGVRLAKTVIEKMLAMVAILSGILFFLIPANAIFRFTSLFHTEEPDLMPSIGFLLVSIIMITAGTWWWIDSTE